MRNGARSKLKEMAAKSEPRVHASSGNVFADLKLPNPGEALAKAELAHHLCELIGQRKWTQAEAAVALGIDQPKVSALIRGRLAGFSTDRLIRFLSALGQEVQIVVRPRARRRS
jgi:predicted XRE-type DNA-binding protein